jgi:hypothetical protein
MLEDAESAQPNPKEPDAQETQAIEDEPEPTADQYVVMSHYLSFSSPPYVLLKDPCLPSPGQRKVWIRSNGLLLIF